MAINAQVFLSKHVIKRNILQSLISQNELVLLIFCIIFQFLTALWLFLCLLIIGELVSNADPASRHH